MNKSPISREEAWNLLTRYNKEEYHLKHALILEGVMRWFAEREGFADETDFWAMVGLLHDLDFELWPEQHCVKCGELLSEAGLPEEFIHAVVSHGWGIVSDVRPEHMMEKILYATDELTGLISAAALVRPSKSVQDLELSSVRKKFKSPAFAAGCSRDVITRGAELLGWSLDDLIEKTILAMRTVSD